MTNADVGWQMAQPDVVAGPGESGRRAAASPRHRPTASPTPMRPAHDARSRRPAPPSGWALWLRLVRANSFPASVVPLLVAAALAVRDPGRDAWVLFPSTVIAAVLLHAGTNVINDHADFTRGVDQGYPLNGSSGVLTRGWLEPAAVRSVGRLLFAAGAAVGLSLVAVRGWPLLLIGLAGVAGGYLYSGGPRGYKYVGLGDVFVLVLMGPLMVIGGYDVLTGRVTGTAVLVSLPVGALVAAILVGNNLRDRAHDRETHVRTLTQRLPDRAAKGEYVGLVAGAFLLVVLLVVAGVVGWPALLVVVALPLALAAVRRVHGAVLDQPEQLRSIVRRTAGLHLVFGVLLAIGIAVSGA